MVLLFLVAVLLLTKPYVEALCPRQAADLLCALYDQAPFDHVQCSAHPVCYTIDYYLLLKLQALVMGHASGLFGNACTVCADGL